MKWLKRSVLIVLFLAVDILASFVGPAGSERGIENSGRQHESPLVPSPLVPAVESVISIFLADVLVLWLLSKIGGL